MTDDLSCITQPYRIFITQLTIPSFFFSFFTNFFFIIPINFFYFLFLKKYTFRLHFSTIQKLFRHTPYSCTFRKFSPYTFSTIPKICHTPLGKFSPYTFSTILKFRHTPLEKFSPYTFSSIPKFTIPL